ncbi:MAG: cation diffusion facilitator family transporter [Candidatus Omnitrophica bacterium]|nr:cation diffusion facilitator family transporter [Candidatus Omnitrophota bacterium]
MALARVDNYKLGEKNAFLGIIGNVFLFAVKLAAGIAGRSQAMIADAFHTASDSATSLGVLIGFKIASRPADDHHPYGHGRAESIMAKLVAIVLIGVGLGIAYSSARVLVSGEFEAPGRIALIVAVISIVVKELVYRRVVSAGKSIGSSSLKADAYHHRSDAISSVAALAGIAAARMGKPFMDPLAGIIVAGFVVKMGIEAFHEAYDELMDAAPPDELRKKITDITLTAEGVLTVKKVMVRKAGIDLYPEITIGVDGEKKVKEGHLVTMKVKQELCRRMNNLKDIVVHVEPVKVNGR